MALRFLRGGRLLAVGEESDARHVAVEFVHPVIVGKRALPALALPTIDALELEREPDDIVVVFSERGVRVLDESFIPPTDDPFVRQELIETLYHVLWELVHVFLEHRDRSPVGAGAACFLYPFLGGRRRADLDAVREDVRRSIEAKAAEIGALREQTLRENAGVLQRRRGVAGPAAARAGQRRLGDRRDGRRRRPAGARAARAGPDRRPGGADRDRQRHRRRGDLLAPGDRPRAAGRHAADACRRRGRRRT